MRLCIGMYSTEPPFLPNTKISDFFSRLMRAAKVRARLCIGINSTEPSLLENAIRTTFHVLFSHKCEQRMLWQDCTLLQAYMSLRKCI